MAKMKLVVVDGQATMVPLTADELAQLKVDAPARPNRRVKKDRQSAIRTDADVAELIDKLKKATPTQIDTWVDEAGTNKVVKAIVKILALRLR